jgi:Spy/CpxP family protein refolding chaperone
MNGKLKALLLLMVMYGLGVASGVAYQHYRFHRFPNPHTAFADRRLKRLKSQLHLSDEQDKALSQIFAQAHERALQINEEVSWDLADIHKDTVQAIQKVLTPDQQATFDKLHQKYHVHNKQMPPDNYDDEPPSPEAHS